MGRPNLTDQRTAEILDAFEWCVGKYGIAGTSLEAVAKEAGMKRSILRHYVGNRDELVIALSERVVAKYVESTASAFDALDDCSGVKPLIDYLFPTSATTDAASLMVIESLIAAADEYPTVRTLVTEYVNTLTERISRSLRSLYPQATRQRCWQVAYGIVGICFNEHSLVSLALPAKYSKASRACAMLLVESLEGV